MLTFKSNGITFKVFLLANYKDIFEAGGEVNVTILVDGLLFGMTTTTATTCARKVMNRAIRFDKVKLGCAAQVVAVSAGLGFPFLESVNLFCFY